MVNLPDDRELTELQAFNEVHCLSIYVPYIALGSTANPNRIKFKNLLHEAETALLADGVKSRDIAKTLGPARQLLDNQEFWPARRESLALFLHPKLCRYYHIPAQATTQSITLAKGFNLKPLLKIMEGNQQYYVLALSHKNVRLYTGDRYHLEQLHLKGFPTDMKQALNIDEYPDSLETHSVALAHGNDKTSDGFHGQYNIHQTDKDMLLEFFHLIDHSLHAMLRDSKKPLIIIGVEYLLPIYRQANSSPYLVAGGLTGNYEKLGLDTIHRQTWAFLETLK